MQVVDTDTLGCGVRALVDGAGASRRRRLSRPRRHGRGARGGGDRQGEPHRARRPVELAPSPAHPNATWKSAYPTDPWTIPVEQKAHLLLKANAEAMKVAKVKYVNSILFFVKRTGTTRTPTAR